MMSIEEFAIYFGINSSYLITLASRGDNQDAFDQRTKHFIEPDSKLSKMNLKSLFSVLLTVLVAIALFISQSSTIKVQGQEVETIPDQQQQVSCGSVITGRVTLSSNLNCNHDGLIVGGGSATIDLNGFQIRGPGIDSSKIGIAVSEDNVKIVGPGVITGFKAGILVTGASEFSVSSVVLQSNEVGILLTGVDSTSVEENNLRNNLVGVTAYSSNGIDIADNLMTKNALAGVLLVNTDRSAATSNNIQGSQKGIFLDSQSGENAVQMNNVRFNIVGLDNANGLAPASNKNTFSTNLCGTSSPSGLCTGN
jgi:parallel beta-helix repeat protein